jgi:phosphoserine phosphatase RsbU/P
VAGAPDADALTDVLVAALEGLPDAVCVADARLPDAPLVWVNPAFEVTTGYAAEEALGRNCRFLNEGLRDQPALDELRQALAQQQPVVVRLRNRRKDGTEFVNELAVRPLHDDAGTLTHYLALQRDVTAEQELRSREAQASAELQSQLVPPKLPDVPGLDVAVRFSPAEDGSGVSGDFYDLYATSSGVGAPATWNAAMGDVSGRGTGAAAYTGTVRNLLKGIGLQGGSPAAALEQLNAALLDELGDRFVTVALAQLQVRRSSVRARIALGGHPQPVVVGEEGARLVGTPGGLVGALPEVGATDEDVVLQPGETLLLHTDGITEAGPRGDLFGDERLLEAAASATGSAAEVADAVLDAVRQHGGDSDDDAALLALRVQDS